MENLNLTFEEVESKINNLIKDTNMYKFDSRMAGLLTNTINKMIDDIKKAQSCNCEFQYNKEVSNDIISTLHSFSDMLAMDRNDYVLYFYQIYVLLSTNWANLTNDNDIKNVIQIINNNIKLYNSVDALIQKVNLLTQKVQLLLDKNPPYVIINQPYLEKIKESLK
jgi:hypothetical protein